MTATNDGFRVVEEDLNIRGPGDFFGKRQSGFLGLRAADLVRDRDLLPRAREEVFRVVEGDRNLTTPEHRRLREGVGRCWKEKRYLASID